MHHSSSQLPSPGRLFLPGCAIAAGLLAVSSPLLAAPSSKRPKVAGALLDPILPLRVGKSASYGLKPLDTVQVEAGADNIVWNADNECLSIKVVATGTARLRISSPGRPARVIRLKLVAARPKSGAKADLTESSAAAPSTPAETLTQATVETASEPSPNAAANQTAMARETVAAASDSTTRASAAGQNGGGIAAQMAVLAPLPKLAPGAQISSSTLSRVAEQVPSTVPNTVPNTLPNGGATPLSDATRTVASPTSEQAPNSNLGSVTTGGVDVGTAGIGSPLSPDVTGIGAGQNGFAPPAPQPPSVGNSVNLGAPATAPAIRPAQPGGNLPNSAPGIRLNTSRPAAPRTPVRSGFSSAVPVKSGPQISPILPAPARSPRANVNYRTAPQLPRSVGTGGAGGGRQGIAVTQGLARLLSFRSNILAVFFSDPNVMDARAINARTIAVTGVGPGASTLAVFTSQFPGDAVGRAEIYRISTTPRGGATVPNERDPRVLAQAITSALGDPRVRANVISRPDGSLFARLSGTVRNPTEVDAAKTTASFFVPEVVSALYADINAPTLEAVTSGAANQTAEGNIQENLRRITGNNSIEIVPLPVGLAFKAEVDSPEEAESLLRILPTLNQQIVPFIVIHNQPATSAKYYNATVPLLNGEDRQLTQKLQEVTSIRTVYAVRTSSNSLACYGNVRTRGEYDRVRRYMTIAAQTSLPAATQGASQGGSTLRPQGGEGPSLPNYDPVGGYRRNLGLQMFVNITDPGQSAIRKVTVETSIVEISRTALRNLGLEYGTVALTSENVSGGTSVLDNNGRPVTSPVIINRTIDPTFQPGTALAGTGFVGGQSLSNINPFRVRLNALVNNGDARILSRPNITSIEGASAQITIGGERPVPKAVATQGAVGTQVEFRRYGVIISMRPTVSHDNTILLQIRADITQPDRTFEINLNGALIPGETVRSVDTTLNVRAGDTIVMGGLITNERRQATSKVPILGDLPIIGSLFQSRRFENNETELAIFMTPQIELMPVDSDVIEDGKLTPGFPALPSREESNGILFQDTARSVG